MEMTMQDSMLKVLVGQKVRVFTGEQYSDSGMLDAFDSQFIRLRTDKGTYLYFPLYSVRLIKPE